MFRLINRAQARLRLPPPYAPFQRRHSSRKASDPLRILFCGSDAFSCESLRALHREHVKNRALVEALDVMVLPGRRTGRGLRTVREGEDSAPPSFSPLSYFLGFKVPSSSTALLFVFQASGSKKYMQPSIVCEQRRCCIMMPLQDRVLIS